MSYKKAEAVLPNELLEMIQEYIDGEKYYLSLKSIQRILLQERKKNV